MIKSSKGIFGTSNTLIRSSNNSTVRNIDGLSYTNCLLGAIFMYNTRIRIKDNNEVVIID